MSNENREQGGYGQQDDQQRDRQQPADRQQQTQRRDQHGDGQRSGIDQEDDESLGRDGGRMDQGGRQQGQAGQYERDQDR